jgi:hypothetical protein
MEESSVGIQIRRVVILMMFSIQEMNEPTPKVEWEFVVK